MRIVCLCITLKQNDANSVMLMQHHTVSHWSSHLHFTVSENVTVMTIKTSWLTLIHKFLHVWTQQWNKIIKWTYSELACWEPREPVAGRISVVMLWRCWRWCHRKYHMSTSESLPALIIFGHLYFRNKHTHTRTKIHSPQGICSQTFISVTHT